MIKVKDLVLYNMYVKWYNSLPIDYRKFYSDNYPAVNNMKVNLYLTLRDIKL